MSDPVQTRAAGLRSRLAEQRGMTIVEAVVAALVLVVMSLGVLQVVDASTRNTYRAEQSQVVVNRLQAELEEVRRLGYDAVALRLPVPSHEPDPAHPNWRVSGVEFDLQSDGGQPAPLVYEGSALEDGGQVGDAVPAAVEAGPESFQSGDVSGQIYRYVVWIDDEACGDKCPGAQDLKRVVVVATLDSTASGGTRAYQELHTDIVDPDTAPVDNPAPDEGDDDGTRPATFWLTDTPCGDEAGDVNERQPIDSDHPTHNTFGVCDDQMQFDAESGAPDLMFTEQPFVEENEELELPEFDYSTDVDGGSDPWPGLRMRPPSLDGCLLPGVTSGLPSGEQDMQTKVHKWLSSPMPAEFTLALSGRATLELWTRTVNQAVHQGRICVWLFKRHLNLLQQPVDTFTVNVDPPLTGLTYYHGHSDDPGGDWSEQWDEISVPMNFSALELLPGERLGLAIAVEREGSQGQQLDFIYDHPQFLSRLEVRTTSELDPLLGDG